MNLWLGSLLTLFFLFVAFDSQGASPTHDSFGSGLLQPVIAMGEDIIDPAHPIARSTVLLLSVESRSAGRIRFSDGEACTGTIVAPDLVVTAAHCVVERKGTKPVRPESLLAEMVLSYDGEARLPRPSSARVLDLRRHDHYRPQGYKNDIALLRLADPIGPGHEPAAILPLSLPLERETPAFVAGFGATSLTGAPSIFQLRMKSGYVHNADARATWVSLRSRSRGGVGNSDSGGPAFSRVNGRLYFWGVLSTGAERDFGSWDYEKVHNFRGWLERAARELGSELTFPQ